MLVTPESEGLGPRGWNIYALPPLEGWKTPFCTVRDARTDIFLFRILDPPRGSREFYLLLHLSSKYFYSRNRRCFLAFPRNFKRPLRVSRIRYVLLKEIDHHPACVRTTIAIEKLVCLPRIVRDDLSPPSRRGFAFTSSRSGETDRILIAANGFDGA